MKNTINLTRENFNEIVINSKVPVVVDFYAEWCGPCKSLEPIIDKLAEEFQDLVTIAKLDVDANEDITRDYFVRGIPAILIFKNGKIVEKKIGVNSIEAYKSTLNNVLEK
jgi:thioredoxin 1